MRKMAAFLLVFVVAIFAKDNKDRERVYDAAFDKVWTACVQAASEKYTVTHSDKTSGVLTFQQGASLRTNSYGMNVGVTVVPVTENQTKVILNPRRSNLSYLGLAATSPRSSLKRWTKR